MGVDEGDLVGEVGEFDFALGEVGVVEGHLVREQGVDRE